MQAWKAVVQACKFQMHVSQSRDPFLNLSIEHYLLQSSPSYSTVLFLYVNKPCVVIGRNQNPWLEVDLSLLKEPHVAGQGVEDKAIKSPSEIVRLVRRRSGGGSVFHDEGNVNYCVICPTADFTRDKHAEMVTTAIRETNLRARVNERHDIVLDQGDILEEKKWPDPTDMHRTIYQPNSEKNPPLKVSGSAYKMIRQRCLHHGTCLVSSIDLPRISRYLRSPAQPFIKARGVESVRSSIGNIRPGEKLNNRIRSQNPFKRRIIKEFQELYGIKCPDFPSAFWNEEHDQEMLIDADGEWILSSIGDNFNSIDEIREGIKELQSSKWLYGQTPQFTLSSHSSEEDKSARPPLPEYFPPSARVYIKVRSGAIDSTKISISPDEDSANAEREKFDKVLKDKNIHDIDNFNDILNQVEHGALKEVTNVSRWLNAMFGKASCPSQ